jgi:hypothetical protein
MDKIVTIVGIVLFALSACNPKHPKEKSSTDSLIKGFNRDTVFQKDNRLKTSMIEDGYLYIDVEDFDDYGGWRMDVQFVHLMGSPYLMATGIGTPVKDATTTINIPKAGEYNVWVRDRNWVKDYAPGRFQVKINNQDLSKEFGAANSDKWLWEKGGKVSLDKGDIIIALSDLTGYYGRCDAILLTTDDSYIPPTDKDAVCKERARFQGLSLEPGFAGKYDVIVVGGGPSGVPAALAAARSGAKTALIQNRPTLGGNASVECGVGAAALMGAAAHHPGWRETGIVEEASRIRAKYFSNDANFSNAFKKMTDDQENLTVFYNQHVFDVKMQDDSNIEGVRAVSTLTGMITDYEGTMFIDCTGDGWVGYYAGAEYRYGREGRDEFNEYLAPEKPDSITMSGCIMGDGLTNLTGFKSEPTDEIVPFGLPEWVKPIEILESPYRSFTTFDRGLWWMEHPGEINDVWQAEEARDELIKVSFAFWDYVKNRSQYADSAKYHKLITIPIMDAKRESRRLVGDYILNQNDVQSATLFPDRISYAGWNIDIHHPKGIYSGMGGSFDYKVYAPINYIPYRTLYSKNIDNLLMAGRCASFSHVALGTTRVMSTLATTGQAAGKAAAMCVDYSITPRDIYKTRMSELQQVLIKDDQSIPGIPNLDDNDLAKTAKITASSFQSGSGFKSLKIMEFVPLEMQRFGIIPINKVKNIKKIKVYLENNNSKATKIKAIAEGAFEVKPFPYMDKEKLTPVKLGTYSLTVPAKSKSWLEIPVDITIPEKVKYLKVSLPQTKGVFWAMMKCDYGEGGRGYIAKEGNDIKEIVVEGQFYAIVTEPFISGMDFSAENVINGSTRLAENPSSMWASDPDQPFPQWLELDIEGEKEINKVQLTFDTDLTGRFSPDGTPDMCVADYDLSVFSKGKWVKVVEEKGNFLRHRVHNFKEIKADKLRLTVNKTNGEKSARVFEVRAYNE